MNSLDVFAGFERYYLNQGTLLAQYQMMLQQQANFKESLFFIPLPLSSEVKQVFGLAEDFEKSSELPIIGITCRQVVDVNLQKYNSIQTFTNDRSAASVFFKFLKTSSSDKSQIHSIEVNHINYSKDFIINKDGFEPKIIKDTTFKKALNELFLAVQAQNRNYLSNLTIFPSVILSSCGEEISKSNSKIKKKFLEIMNADLEIFNYPIKAKNESLTFFMAIKSLKIYLPKPLKNNISDFLYTMRNVSVPKRFVEQWAEPSSAQNNAKHYTFFPGTKNLKRENEIDLNQENDSNQLNSPKKNRFTVSN